MNMTKLPEGWQNIELAELGEIITGTTPRTNEPEYYNGPYMFIAPGDIGKSMYVTKTQKYLSEQGLKVSRALPKDTVLVVCIGATIGKVALSSASRSSTNQQINAIIPNKNVVSQYLYYSILYRAPDLPPLAGRAAVPIVNKSNFAKFAVPLPPLPEQQAIAQTLRAVQQAREARRRELALERERKATLMQYLFTHGTQAESVSTQKTRFGEVPKHWKTLPLYECSFVQTGVTKGRNFGSNPTITLPYLRVANVQDGFLDLSEIKEIRILKSEIDRFRLQVGDVVLTEGGDFDKLGRGFIWHGEIPDCVHQNHVFAVRVNRDLLQPEYFAYFVQSNYGKAYFLSVAHRTTNLASINSTKLKDLPTLIPPLSEQSDIAKTLQACDTKIAALERESALLEELFRALLEELMTGRIRVKAEG